MAKFKIGDKVVVVDELSTNGDYYNGDVGIITKFDTPASKACFVERETDGLSMNVYFSEIEHLREKEMNAEQIRDEILRIDVRIEEAEKDIENAENERNSLVEKLREKGFEIVKPPSFKGRLHIGDKVKVIDNTTSHGFPIGSEVKVQSVYDNYYDCVDLEGVKWCCYDQDVEKI